MNGTEALPPRPEPPRRTIDATAEWLRWFGPARLVVSAISVVAIAAGGWWLVRSPAAPTEAGIPFSAPAVASAASTLPPPTPAPGTVPPARQRGDDSSRPIVHVAGAVMSPGVYELNAGARVDAAIEAAGGATDAADLDGLNLASVVSDGQRVYVPVAGEVDPAAVPSGATSASHDGDAVEPPIGPIDLNTATVGQLETLPGVGPATAAAIVGDRDRHGPFPTVADLERVPGIGPAKLAAIADLVTV